MENFINDLNDLIWSDALILLCIFSGLYFTIRTRFIQFTYIRETFKLLFQKNASDKGISSFQAFALTLAGKVGTGNIIGVAGAIAMGGPGAIFWMWVLATFGAASAFIESTLGQVYKQEINGEFRGGPAYYIEKGLDSKWLGIIFAMSGIICSTFLTPGIQSNSIAETMNNAFGISTDNNTLIPVNITGIFVVFLLVLIIFGGVKRVGQAAGTIVPFMAGAYLLVGLSIIFLNFKHIPEIFRLIISSALGQDAVFGGIVGSAITWGVKRGIFSNEAGSGTAPHAAAAAAINHPAEQGIVQAFSVYVDTLMVCTITALMILFTGQYNVIDEQSGNLITENLKGLEYTGFTQSAIAYHFPSFGNEFVAIALFFFAFTTILSEYYIAETNLVYISSSKSYYKTALFTLRILFLGGVYLGSIKKASLIWSLGEIPIGIMAWMNFIVILALGGTALKVWNDYKTQRKQGIETPTFNAKKSGIQHADYWKDK